MPEVVEEKPRQALGQALCRYPAVARTKRVRLRSQVPA